MNSDLSEALLIIGMIALACMVLSPVLLCILPQRTEKLT